MVRTDTSTVRMWVTYGQMARTDTSTVRMWVTYGQMARTDTSTVRMWVTYGKSQRTGTSTVRMWVMYGQIARTYTFNIQIWLKRGSPDMKRVDVRKGFGVPYNSSSRLFCAVFSALPPLFAVAFPTPPCIHHHYTKNYHERATNITGDAPRKLHEPTANSSCNRRAERARCTCDGFQGTLPMRA